MIKHFLIFFTVTVSLAQSTVTSDNKRKQGQVLDLFVGLGHNKHFRNNYSDWDISKNFKNFVDKKYPEEFLAAYKRGFLPYDGIMAFTNRKVLIDDIKLFDLFYFAKDFDTFYKAASWARTHVNPAMFEYSFTLAIFHRPDTQDIAVPPLYEIIPNFFVPQDTLNQVFEYKMLGRKEGQFDYNNTGCEYNANDGEFGGPFDTDNRGYSDFRVSYFMEDVGVNSNWAYWVYRSAIWMSTEKYGPLPQLERRGERFYNAIQQVFARYTLERLARNLPYAPLLDWHNPIQVGYNPRISYSNGKSMQSRPDNMVPIKYSRCGVLTTEALERRIWDLVDSRMVRDEAAVLQESEDWYHRLLGAARSLGGKTVGLVWPRAATQTNKTLLELTKENGTEILGRMIYGTDDRPSKNYFKPLYFLGIDTLAYLASTATDRSFAGNALSSQMTAPRDPLFYMYLGRLLLHFEHFKNELGPYKHQDVFYPGVKITNVKGNRFVTYLEKFEFDVTNSVPLVDKQDFTNHRYTARQLRLNHKPYRFSISVHSKAEGDAVVRVFIGPKYDSDERVLHLKQSRILFFEIDRFPAKLSPGHQILERNSWESTLFDQEEGSFRSLYNSVNNKDGRCGLPSRLQLPLGRKEGRTYRLAVIISPLDAWNDSAGTCGRLYDGRAMGFPFDRPISEDEYKDVPNFFMKDLPIYKEKYTESIRIDR